MPYLPIHATGKALVDTFSLSMKPTGECLSFSLEPGRHAACACNYLHAVTFSLGDPANRQPLRASLADYLPCAQGGTQRSAVAQVRAPRWLASPFSNFGIR